MKTILLLVNGALFLQSVVGYGQTVTPPLVTDRPDQTESASVVPHRHFQVETGAVFESNLWRHTAMEPERRALSLATTLLRVGLQDWAEIRVASAYRSESQQYSDSRSDWRGFEALSVGTKLGFWAEKGFLPQVALILALDLPVGAQHFRPDSPEPTAIFAFAHTLSERLSLGYNLGATWPSTSGRILHYTASLGYGVSAKAGVFVELYGDDGLTEPASLLFDTGFTYLLRPALQLDGSVGFALSENLPGWFVSGGVSVRLPD